MNLKILLVLISMPLALTVTGVAGYVFSTIDKFHPDVVRAQTILDEITACPGVINKEIAEEWFSLQLKKEKSLEGYEKALNELIRASANIFLLLAAFSLWQGISLMRLGKNMSNSSLNSTSQSDAS